MVKGCRCRSVRFAALVFLLVSTISSISEAEENVPTPIPKAEAVFKPGDLVSIECKKTRDSQWSTEPICKETNAPLGFLFGRDHFVYCGLTITTQTDYDLLVKYIKLEETWHCRVPMTPERKFYVPFILPIWGIVEDDHIHVDNHINFAFHVDSGTIIGAAAYAVKDRFQYGKVGSLINMHGPVRWFSRHSFDSLVPAQVTPDDILGESASVAVIIGWCGITFLTASTLFTVLYHFHLKPNIAKKFLKKD
mmetsp:Transcript_24089/g.41444  ORF Transcript_24089/g.41444 Transcript_24089/m.41444 type:complete len:250 (-) Transcript_24089:159-908(-)